MERYVSAYKGIRINRNIVECKLEKMNKALGIKPGINRNIVECKWCNYEREKMSER